MYYLNDQHPEWEYVLYCRHENALPFFVRTFDSYEDVCRFINELVKRHNHYRQIFYIDNDFYKNQYSINLNGTYYKFLRRPVADWQEFSKWEVA